MNRKHAVILFLILVCAFILRLYKITGPLSDFYSWRKADTAAVSRNFQRYGFDLLRPIYDDLSNVQSGVYNPKGYRMVEFPLYNAATAAIQLRTPWFSLETVGRLISIGMTLLLISVIYYLLLMEVGAIAAVAGSLVFALNPFFIYFTRVILPEPTAISSIFIAIYLSYRFSHLKSRLVKTIYFTGSIIFLSAALLIKPTVIFYTLVLAYIFLRKYGLQVFKKIHVYVYFIVAGIPLIAWRLWITKFPEGIPASQWLITSVNTYQGLQNIFFRPAFFRWIFFERINNLILGGYATVFLVIGTLKKYRSWFPFTILASSLLYLFTFQGGNVQHEYYQIMIFPAVAFFVGSGIQTVFEQQNKVFVNRYILAPVIVALITFSFLISFYSVKNYYNTSSDLLTEAKIIQTLTPQDATLVTDTTGDTTLLYLANRRGFPAVTDDLSILKKEHGASYFVTQKQEVIDQIKSEKKFKVIFENEKFALFAL